MVKLINKKYILTLEGDKIHESIAKQPKYHIEHTGETKKILNYPASPFTEAINDLLSKEKLKRKQSKWIAAFTKADIISKNVTSNLFKLNKKLNEPQTIRELVKTLSSKTNLFVGNSLPIRDFDCFSGTSSKSFNIYFNRGASGIDGIVSTALGVASIKKPTI